MTRCAMTIADTSASNPRVHGMCTPASAKSRSIRRSSAFDGLARFDARWIRYECGFIAHKTCAASSCDTGDGPRIIATHMEGTIECGACDARQRNKGSRDV